MRLDRFLSNKNFGSRKKCKQIILNLRVKVNGKLTTKNDLDIKPSDIIELDNSIIPNDEYNVIMLNKPQNYICSLNDEGYTSAIKLIPTIYQKEFRMVGRLDVDTTGLLLFTNNGILNARLTHPKYNVKKKYLVEVNHILKEELVNIFKVGNIDIGKNEITKSAILEILTPYKCYLTIQEGKYHEIKRLFGKFSYDVIKLQRVEFAFLKLDVEEGKYRLLTEKEYNMLLESVNLRGNE